MRTKYPWIARLNPDCDHRSEVLGRNETVCVATCGTGNEAYANAKLIAAAPDLLEALEYMLAWTGAIPPSVSKIGPPTEQEATAKAIAAIARAQG